MAVKHNFDVLSVVYGFQAANLDLTTEHSAHLEDEAAQAAGAILHQGYDEVCLVGKSLGTPLAAGLAKQISVRSLSLILLTPIGGAFDGLDDLRTLAVMGTDDPLYSPDIVSAFRGHIEWQVFDGLNHSLEVKGDWRASLAALEKVITVCEAFIAGKTG
jgi:hypothetical protein